MIRKAAASLLLVALAASILSGWSEVSTEAAAAAAREPKPVRYGERQAMPQARCGPDDAVETDLQGRVPPQDVTTGRAFQPYSCNLELVGHFPSNSFANFEALGDCAYWGRRIGAGGVQVLDVADPASPLPTATLTTPAMLDPWETLRVHAGRKLLVAASQYHGFLDIYDVAEDCRQPRLVSSTDLSPAIGHEGWFSPDGMTYYMSTTGAPGQKTVFPIDISDPSTPRLLASWAFTDQTHGGWTTEDGTRSFICQQTTPPNDALHIVDTTAVATRQEDPQPRVISTIPLGDNQWCQNAYRLTYGPGKRPYGPGVRPYLVVFGERAGAPDCSRVADGWATYAYPRFYDIADERKPTHVADALLEVQLPEHCQDVQGEGVAINGFGYSVHYCSPDRLYNPTILACSWFGSGLRVLDIRDPERPVELGYYNPAMPYGAVAAGARPVVRAERGEIWFVTDSGGFYVVRFRDGVWPFRTSPRCPRFDDFWYAHYNEDSTCRTATTDGVGRPAPGTRRR